jgi:hypothetical protein
VSNDELYGERPKPRLEPMKSGQVWMFDAARVLTGRDGGALVITWLIGFAFLTVASAAANVVLYVVSGVLLLTAAWWTFSRTRAARENASIHRFANSRPDKTGNADEA